MVGVTHLGANNVLKRLHLLEQTFPAGDHVVQKVQRQSQ
jgi:hypothetical protein